MIMSYVDFYSLSSSALLEEYANTVPSSADDGQTGQKRVEGLSNGNEMSPHSINSNTVCLPCTTENSLSRVSNPSPVGVNFNSPLGESNPYNNSPNARANPRVNFCDV